MGKKNCRESYDYVDYEGNRKRKYSNQIKSIESAYKTNIGNIEIRGRDADGYKLHLTLFRKSGAKQIEKLKPFLKEQGKTDVITTSHPSSQIYKFGDPTTIHVEYTKYDPKELEGVWIRSDRAVGYRSDGISIQDPIIIPDKRESCKRKGK